MKGEKDMYRHKEYRVTFPMLYSRGTIGFRMVECRQGHYILARNCHDAAIEAAFGHQDKDSNGKVWATDYFSAGFGVVDVQLWETNGNEPDKLDKMYGLEAESSAMDSNKSAPDRNRTYARLLVYPSGDGPIPAGEGDAPLTPQDLASHYKVLAVSTPFSDPNAFTSIYE